MKRLLIALVAAVAVSTGFAKLTQIEGFEGSSVPGAFEPSAQNEDESELVAYDNDGPTSVAAPYNFSGFGSKYLALDTGNATLWCTNSGAATYFDMVMQFNPSATAPTPESDTKIAVYVNSSSNLVVLADGGPFVTTSSLNPGTWGRLTISAVTGGFQVRLNGELVKTSGDVNTFPPLTGDATINSIGFNGSGKLDDFVARTTDPFSHPANYVAKVGGDDGEYYTTFAAALADGQTSVTFNGNPFHTADGEAYDAETNPYVIANVEDLLALMYAVKNGTEQGNTYVQTADIDMTSISAFPGIGESGDVVAAGIAFTGVYNGNDHTISNVTLAENEYAGIFRKVYGTVKNLTVNNMGFGATPSSDKSYGCAIVGEADNNAVLQNLVAQGTFCGVGDAGARHNTAGIVCVVQTATGNGTVTIASCTNNATIYGRHHRLGGILAYTRNEGNVIISNCVNNGNLIWTSKSSPADPRGIAGIVACPEGTGTVTIMDCVNTGSFTVNGAATQANVDAATGDIVGHFYGTSSSGTFVENGGNTYRAAGKLSGKIAGTVTVTKCPYAIASTVDAVDYLTTVKQADLAAGNTYTLLADVAAGNVYTLAAANDSIAFNTNGFNFAGTVAAGTGLGVAAKVSDTTITYSAGIAAVDNVAYPTFAAAVAALEEATDDYVTLLANAETTLAIGDTLKVKTGLHNLVVNHASNAALIRSTTDDNVTTFQVVTRVAHIIRDAATINYASLQAAFEGAVVGDTVYLDADSDEAVTVSAGKSFTFVENENATFSGTFDGAGTVAMTAAPKAYVYTGAANGGTLFANGWTGTFQIAWNPGSVCFVFDDFGNANSVVKISGANDGANDTFGAFPSTFWVGSTLGAPSIAPAIELACTWTIANGWTGTTTAFSKLSGTGDLAIQNTTYARSYSISTLDGYAGTISTGKHEVRFGNIVNAGAAFDVCLVKAGTTFTCDLTSSQVNGAAATLAVGTVNDQKGIYLARAAVNGTGYVTVAEAIDAAEAACANTVAVLDGTSVAYQGWTFENGVYTYASYRAKIGETGYPTLSAAVAAAGENEVTIDLVDHIWEDVTVPANVTVAVADDVQIRGGTLSGAGRFVYTKVPNQFRFTFDNWTGTVTLNYANIVSAGDLANQIVAYGDGNSVVEIGPNGTVTGNSYLNSDLRTTLKVNGYVSINNGSTDNKRMIPRVTGGGVLVFGNKGNMVNYDVQELVDWTGIITNNASKVLVTNLVSGVGTVVFNVAAPAVTVGESFDGSVVYNATPSGAPVVDADSECEVCLNFNYAGMNIAPYGNAKSTITLGDLSADNAYLNDGDGNGTGQIPSKVVVAGNVTINNGWTQYPDYSWTGSKTLQFNEFKVDGSFALLSTRTWNDAHCYYYIKSLNGDGAGSITVGAGYSLRIDAVDFAEAPSGDDCIVPLTVGAGTASATAGELCGADGVRNGSIPVTVNGEATEQSLVYDAGKGGLVLYVAPTPKATYDGTDYMTVQDALNVAYTARPASFGKVITVLDENWEDTGLYDEYFTWDSVARTYTVITYPARIAATYYPSLAAAVTAATDGDTIVLTADASMPSVEFGEKYGVNCAQGDSEIVINKAITLDGNGHTIYGLANYFTHEMADGCHDLFITGNKNVTIKNVTLADFGGSAYVSKFTYPIWAGQGYTGTLVLDNVTVTNFNRTAFNFNGGTVVVTNCTVVGDAPTPRNTNSAYFQNGIGVLNANVTVFDSTFSGIGAYDPDNADSNAAECFQLMGNGATSGTGSITVNGGSYSGQYVAIVADNATGTIALNGGDFVGTLDVEEGSTGSIAVSGGTFDRQVPAAYCASGKVPTTTADAQGKYTVVDYVPPSGIDPTSDAGAPIAVDTTKTPEEQAADAQAAAAAMDVQKTADATSVDQATWNGYFTKTAEKVNDAWVAKAELNPAVVLPVDGAEETPLTDMLESVAATAVDATGETKASVPTKAGLYYWIEGATEVGAASYTPGTAVLGNGGTQSLTRPTLTGENGKAFFKVCVGVTAPTKD